MLIWKNTATLDGFDEGLRFTTEKEEAEIAILGSKSIDLSEFPNLKGIFRLGIGRDNVPLKQAESLGIEVRFPSENVTNIIYAETARFTCSLIIRMLYINVGSIDPWSKFQRGELRSKTLLVLGLGNIGQKVVKIMETFMKVITYDILSDDPQTLQEKMRMSDCITLHIPSIRENESFIDKEKLSWMKDEAILINTARGIIVNEEALLNELLADRIRAAFDVYWDEPYSGKLMKIHPDRFFMTPHVASTCNEFLIGCRRDLESMIISILSC